MSALETISFQGTEQLRRKLETEAARLHLSLGAYILYLHTRSAAGAEPDRLDRHVHEVFGRHGELMRRLAK